MHCRLALLHLHKPLHALRQLHFYSVSVHNKCLVPDQWWSILVSMHHHLGAIPSLQDFVIWLLFVVITLKHALLGRRSVVCAVSELPFLAEYFPML